ncbi:MAG: hypothetical protein HND55_05895 [Pseudomonadota bacterium]|nr:MAG: hypothetical protein HND55_05895 [Pseudomonadota bacterium]
MFDLHKASVKKTIKRSLLIIGIAFIGILAYTSWDVLLANIQRANTFFLISSVVLAISGLFINGVYFQTLLLKHGCEAHASDGVKAFVTSQAAKYIPGKVWGVAYQIAHLGANKQSMASVSFAVVQANVEFVLGAIVFTLFTALAAVAWIVSPIYSLLVVGLGAVVFASLSSSFMVRAFIQGIVVRLFGLSGQAAARNRSTWKVSVMLFMGQSALYFFSLVFAIHSVFELSVNDMLVVIAIHSFSVVASSLVFLVPAGVGVREILFFALSKLLPLELTLEELAALVVLLRALQIVIEATAIGLAQFISPSRQRTRQR